MRNIENAISNYQKYIHKPENAKTGAGTFTAYDFQQIKDRSGGILFDAIDAALCAGFWVGYQRAKREMKQDQANEKQLIKNS